jgi:hypothetical protein
MIIEFSYVGNGTNIGVFLIDRLDAGWPPAEAVVDRIFTADRQARFHYPEERGIPVNARQVFQAVEETWAPPIIGGRYGRFHPYFAEREEKRKAREFNG